MGENKKIKNATPVISNGIRFRSRLEEKVYAYLLKKGITASYEPYKIKLWSIPKLTVPFFDRWGSKFKRITSKPRCITYEPDFTFTYNNIYVFLEVKGFKNDVFPYKVKLFRQWLEEKSKESDVKYCYAIVYAIKDLETLFKYLDET